MHQHICPSGHGAFDLSVIEFALRFGKTIERAISFYPGWARK